MVPFCQSELFLGHLCGSPPVALDDIISVPSDKLKARPSISERTFSLAQFRYGGVWMDLGPIDIIPLILPYGGRSLWAVGQRLVHEYLSVLPLERVKVFPS